MDNIQTGLLSGFKQSIASIKKFGEELEGLDSRFGRLDQRIQAMQSSLGALDSQMIERKDEIENIIKAINDVKILPSEKLKRYLVEQINLINNKIIDKVREQIDLQVQSIMQEVNTGQAGPLSLTRSGLIPNVKSSANSGDTGSKSGGASGSSSASSSSDQGAVSSSKRSGLTDAVIKSFGGMMGKNSDIPVQLLSNAVDTFKTVQNEQIKMMQTMMMKNHALSTKPKDNVSDPSKTMATTADIPDIQKFVRQQSIYYGTDYGTLTKVAGVGVQQFDDPAEIKKFVQLAAQLQTLEPGSDIMKIAGGLGSVISQFDLALADVQEKVAQPLAAVTEITRTPSTKIIEEMRRFDAANKGANMDPDTAIVMAATSIKSAATEGVDINTFYNNALKSLQSDHALSRLAKLGIEPYKEEDITGTKTVRPANELFTEVARALTRMDSSTRSDTYRDLFGSEQISKEAGSMSRIMDNFVETMNKVDRFNQGQYENTIKASLDNPMVNANRAHTSISVALDALTQEFTPAINKVSYMLMNMAGGIEKNAAMLADLGGIFATMLTGLMAWRGIKWVGNKPGVNILENVETQRTRTGFINSVGGLRTDGLLSSAFGNLTRKQVGEMQKNPLLDGYIRKMDGMTEKQRDHFKAYLSDKRINVKDLPTLFTAMDEAPNWEKRPDLTNVEKYSRLRQYNNRLSTRPEVASALSSGFLGTLNSSTASLGAFNSHRTNADYSNVSDRMSRMTQKEFAGFENSLVERQSNGLPPIHDITSLSRALDHYSNSIRESESAARRATPAYGSLSNAIRSLNSSTSSAGGIRERFRNFLKDIPNLARGAGSSIVGLTKNIAKMGVQMAAMYALGKVVQSVTEASTVTADQKKLAEADAREKQNTYTANRLSASGSDHWWQTLLNPEYLGLSFYGSVGNWGNKIEAFSGTSNMVSHDKYMDDLSAMKKYYGFSGTGEEFAKWLKKEKGLTGEQAVNQWYQNTGEAKKNEQMRQEGINEQYKQSQLKAAEESSLQETAKKEYEKQYKDGLLNFSSVNSNDLNQRLDSGLTKVKEEHSQKISDALMGGLSSYDPRYIEMRKAQVEAERQVLEDELAIIDSYISKAKKILETADPNSEEYKNAQKTLDNMKSVREEVKEQGEKVIKNDNNEVNLEIYQKQTGASDMRMQRIELMSQAKELEASYYMDTQSKEYYDAMKNITQNKISQMQAELENLRAIKAQGDQTEEHATKILQTQNNIAQERVNLKQLRLDSITLGRQRISDNMSDRENELLSLQVRSGITDESSPILRNKRIANYKSEISDINELISQHQSNLKTAGAGEAVKIQQEIRDLQKQSLQAQLGILQEVKTGAGTFNMPQGVTAMSRYEYLTRNGTHTSTTVGMGDVTVNITLPNVTSATSAEQLQQIGAGLGQGLAQGRVGGIRQQLGGNPQTGYRSRYGR